MNPSSYNSSSGIANATANKLSTDEKILDIFATKSQATGQEIFDEFAKRGWATAKTNVLNSSLARLTNGGLLRQLPNKAKGGKTIWERTALKTPLEDKRLNRKEIITKLQTIQRQSLSMANTIRHTPTFQPDPNMLGDFAAAVQEILVAYDGHQDRSGEAEFQRRVSLGL